jgi:hypothetical protein
MHPRLISAKCLLDARTTEYNTPPILIYNKMAGLDDMERKSVAKVSGKVGKKAFFEKIRFNSLSWSILISLF